MPNPFLEGAPYTQMMRALEFAAEYHTISKDSNSNPLQWLTVPQGEAIQLLEDAFFDSCVATQSYVVKSIALMVIFDNYPRDRVEQFIKRASSENQAYFIHDALIKLSKLVERTT